MERLSLVSRKPLEEVVTLVDTVSLREPRVLVLFFSFGRVGPIIILFYILMLKLTQLKRICGFCNLKPVRIE